MLSRVKIYSFDVHYSELDEKERDLALRQDLPTELMAKVQLRMSEWSESSRIARTRMKKLT